MTPPADRGLLDTNVLLAATDESRRGNAQALEILTEWPAAGFVPYTSGQVLREYLAVATRPVDRNGLGLHPDDAAANVSVLRSRLRFLVEDEKVHRRLLDLITDVACSGKQVQDANVVATALVHGVGTVVTGNVADFDRFAGEVRLVELTT